MTLSMSQVDSLEMAPGGSFMGSSDDGSSFVVAGTFSAR